MSALIILSALLKLKRVLFAIFKCIHLPHSYNITVITQTFTTIELSNNV